MKGCRTKKSEENDFYWKKKCNTTKERNAAQSNQTVGEKKKKTIEGKWNHKENVGITGRHGCQSPM